MDSLGLMELFVSVDFCPTLAIDMLLPMGYLHYLVRNILIYYLVIVRSLLE